ncbi:hypothetical protein [Candidatus Lokiarchaeum ossiferum]|uniref:hypothetical protein n=1 Tax=Candidatus Lokiarchaeum ossiferum TaxID=2951803 RepID=UPI00352F6443
MSPQYPEKSQKNHIKKKKRKRKRSIKIKPIKGRILEQKDNYEKNGKKRISKVYHSFSDQEEKILEIGKRAYYKALAYYYYPSLPDPEFIFDYSKKIGFFINLDTYGITLNLANTPNIYLENELEDYFFSLSLHEISHYIFCPYDTLTNFRLLAAAIRGGVNKYYSPMVVNIFADLIIDQKNHADFPDLMNWELLKTTESLFDKSANETCSNLTKVLIECYEILWGIQIIPNSQRDEIRSNASKNICQIILKNFSNENLWEKKVKAIGKQLVEILKKEVQLNNNFQQENIKQKQSPFILPDDVLNIFGDLTELKNPDLIKQKSPDLNAPVEDKEEKNIQNLMEELAPELSFNTMRDLLSLHGYTDSTQNLALWYRGQAKGLIQIEYFQRKKGGSIPLYPETWRIGDAIESFDPIQSLLVSPVIIPNMTTRKWKYDYGIGQEKLSKIQDIMIVLDSSGSMDWNFNKKSISGRYHISLLAAFSAMQYSLQRGSYISAINFSEQIIAQPWTNDLTKIERVLLSYQGFGTRLPTKKIEEFAQKAENPSLILVISDLEIENWAPSKKLIKKLLAMGHKIISFFIDGDQSILLTKNFQELMERGAKFYCIDNIDDLIGLVLSEVKVLHQ